MRSVSASKFVIYCVSQGICSYYQISFDEEKYKIPEGFYLFMYDFDGPLKAHGFQRDSFGKSLEEILPHKSFGTAQDGRKLHKKFVDAVSNRTAAWVQYRWRNSLDEEAFTKIAFLVKYSFGSNQYYLGAGFDYAQQEYPTAPLGKARQGLL